jgi:steroid delta-isomerase-like uncharacterized protein
MERFVEAKNKALVRKHYGAVINWFEPEAIRKQLAPGYFDHESGRVMSADDVIAHAQNLHAIFRDLSVTLDDMVAEGDRVAVRATWRGVHAAPFRGIAPTGKRFAFTGMVFWRVRDGKITERWAEIGLGALAAQLSEQPAAA